MIQSAESAWTDFNRLISVCCVKDVLGLYYTMHSVVLLLSEVQFKHIWEWERRRKKNLLVADMSAEFWHTPVQQKVTTFVADRGLTPHLRTCPQLIDFILLTPSLMSPVKYVYIYILGFSPRLDHLGGDHVVMLINPVSY